MNNDLEFINYFWSINFSDKEKERFKKFLEVDYLKKKGFLEKEISNKTKTPKGTIEKWIRLKSVPYLVHYSQYSKNLRKPQKDYKWLAINSTRGGILKEPWIKVPEKINSYRDLIKVIKQLKSINNLKDFNKFNINFKSIEKMKPLLFAYLLGMFVGDTSKKEIKRKNRTTRRIQLRLSTRFKTNKMLGEFTKLCANNIGLRMNQGKNCPKGKRNTHDFYAWHSQSSLLIQWIFKVCLGLKNKEKTTYDPIKANWLIKAPKEFKIYFLQGLADSDGYIDITTHRAGIITGPNTKFIKELLKTININGEESYLHKGSLGQIKFRLEKAIELPLFSPHVKSYRYQLMEKIMKAKRLHHHWPAYLGKEVDNYLKEGFSSTKIMQKVLNNHNIIIRQGGINKRRNKIKMENRITCLGIESTAQ
ncbi:MAG: hypothetical protein KKC38_02195 [Nanoarchaeota archaeon]|nr:hypothetical protein [Nanoarchaeota archaeon]